MKPRSAAGLGGRPAIAGLRRSLQGLPGGPFAGIGVASVIASVLLFALAGGSDLSAAERARLLAGGPQAQAQAAARAKGDDGTAASDGGSTAAPSAEAPAAADAGAAADASGDDGSAGDDESGDAGGSGGTGGTTPTEIASTKVRHVFVITLAGVGVDAAFGSGSAATYLAGDLREQGVLLPNFTSLGGSGIADRIAFAGGQPPNASTKAGCTTYREIPPDAAPSTGGVIDADGCVYPNSVVSIGDQLTGKALSWQVYAEDHDKGPGGAAATCRRPVSGEEDATVRSRAGDAYAARSNPFVYFHSLLDLGGCDADVGPLTTLDADLADAKRTPNFAYIVPNLCHDAGESPCVDGPGGLAGADAFLKDVVPKILASAAFKADGLLVVTFAGGPSDAASRNGTLFVSQFAQTGSTDETASDPYGLLRTVEDLLGLKPLAKAADARSLVDTALPTAREAVAGGD